MEEIFTQIKYLTDTAAPKKLAKKTMRRIMVIKLRPLIYIAILLLAANLIFLSSHIYHYLIESEAIAVIKAFLQDFEFSFDYIGNLFLGLQETISLFKLLVLAVNLSLFAYMVNFFRRYHNELLN